MTRGTIIIRFFGIPTTKKKKRVRRLTKYLTLFKMDK